MLERADGRWIPLFSDSGRIIGLIADAQGGRLKITVLNDGMGRSNNLFKDSGRTSLISYTLELTATAGTVTAILKGAQGGHAPGP